MDDNIMFLLVQKPQLAGGYEKLFAFSDLDQLEETQSVLKEAGYSTTRIHWTAVSDAEANVNPMVGLIHEFPQIVVLPELDTVDW